MSGKFALIIGNTEYVDSGLAQLTAPGKDAEDFARVLKDQEICAFDNVNILLNQPEYIVRGAIEELFDQKKPNDLLVLYFTGHGVRDELGALYLAVQNTVRGRLRSTAIKSDYIREAMDQSRSKRQVLILDCCNSGAFAQGTKAATGVSIGTASAFEGTGYGRVVLTASDATQFAWEGNKVIGETDKSLFTHFLIKGLEGEADKNRDGKITIDDLYDYTYEQIVIRTPKQTPGKWSYKQQGEIALRELTEAQQEQIRILEEGERNRLAKEETDKREREKAAEQVIAQLRAEKVALEHQTTQLRAAREANEVQIVDITLKQIVKKELMRRANWVIISLWLFGWAIAGLIGAILGGTDERASAFSYILGGLVTAIILKYANILSTWESIIFVILGWTIGVSFSKATFFGVGSWIVNLIEDATYFLVIRNVVFLGILGIVGGLTIALTLKYENVLSTWEKFIWITLGWTIGGVISGIIWTSWLHEINYPILWTITTAVNGAFGGLIMLWKVRKIRI